MSAPAELLQRQRELEDNSYAEGGRRFRRRLEAAAKAGNGATAGAGLKILKEGLEPLEAAINCWIEETTTRRGPKHCAIKWIEKVTPEVAAYLVLKSCLDGFARTTNVRTAALEISQMILDELRFRRFEQQAPALFAYARRNLHTSNYDHQQKALGAALKYSNDHPREGYARVNIKDLDMSPTHRVLVGVKLIDLLIESTGLVEKVSRRHAVGRNRFQTDLFLRPTADTLSWVAQRNDAMEFLNPVYMPMVVEPLDWAPGERGGYRFKLRGKEPLVRRTQNTAREQVIAKADMPMVYNALNTIQRTAYRINPAVFDLVTAIERRGGDLAGLPGFDDEALPPKPVDIETNEVARRAWRRVASQAHERNHLRGIKRKEVSAVMAAATAVRDADRIYFPFNLDFRGRIYPIANYLSPQGDDLSRGLLTFSAGKPLGADGAAWLAIHLANCLDITPEGQKVSALTFDERCSWVQRNTARLQQVAKDPFADLWWTTADAPLQFFAACVEWAGFADLFAQGRGDEYVCSLPIAMDGSCNGLQHFSAMLRDARGGRAVNLVPQDAPQDVYQRVTDGVLAQLVPLAVDDPIAAKWLASGLVTRKLCKRPTMTFGYGSKRFGFKSQIEQYLQGLDEWHAVQALFTAPDGKGEIHLACTLMSGLILQAIREEVASAYDAMAWMQQAARLVVDSGKPVEWTVPVTGFPVRQEYFESIKRQVKTILAGSIVQPAVYSATDKVTRHRQRNAIAPNVVHSLDAAALMMCVTDAHEQHGVEAFSMVHDSYATLAADTTLLAHCIRQTFYRLYAGTDVMGSLDTQFRAQCEAPDDLSPPPAPGTLDLAGVLASPYFFA